MRRRRKIYRFLSLSRAVVPNAMALLGTGESLADLSPCSPFVPKIQRLCRAPAKIFADLVYSLICAKNADAMLRRVAGKLGRFGSPARSFVPKM